MTENLTRTAVDEAVEVVRAHTLDHARHDGFYCLCGAGSFASYNGQRKHEAAMRRRAFAALPLGMTPEQVLAIAARIAEVEAIADAAEPAEVEETAPVVTVERLVADTLRLGYRTVREYVEAPGREIGQVTPWTLDRAERAFAREVERTRLHDDPPVPTVSADGLVHLMSDALLDACGTAPSGGLHLAPDTTPERITCPACRRLLDEADVSPTVEERATVRIRARELRRGDLVVDSLGEVQYAAFDTDAGTHIRDGALVRVWTAIRDQERGLPPVLTVPAERELLVLRPMSEEGRELATRAGWVDAPDRAQQGDDSTVIVLDGFRPHVDTTVRCLGCGQLITVNVDGDTECGGAGEGTCDALDGHAGPVEDSHHDAADAAHDALLGYQLAHEARA
jgi:hypothetical protein